MDKPQLLKKLDAMLDEAKRTSQWGTIEIVLQYGEAVTLHETRTTKLRKEGNTHDPRFETR
jgi:hypothetical protein